MSQELIGNRLQTRAQALLTQRECHLLKLALGDFRETKSVLTFCRELQTIISAPQKLPLLRELYLMIPDHLRCDFQQLCSLHFGNLGARVLHDLVAETPESMEAPTPTEPLTPPTATLDRATTGPRLGKSPSRSDKKSKRTPKKDESKRRDKKERKRTKSSHQGVETLASAAIQSTEAADPAHATSPAREINIRKVKLEHKNGISLGFCIRGGVDLRTGIFISQVDPGSQAEKKGLKTGERILKVNDTPFKNVTHAEAVVALKSSQKLTLYVAQFGQMPGASVQATALSPGQHAGQDVRSPGNKGKTVTVVADEDGWLGCSIRGGSDYNMEVCVASVDPLSPALRAGLKRGQKISKVNDVDVRSLTHLQIVNLVTASNLVRFVVKPPGKSRRSTSISSPREQKIGDFSGGTQPSNGEENIHSARRVARRHSSPPKSQPDRSVLSRPTTPLRAGQNYQEGIIALEQELQSTPPVSSSTPLPPEDHPALLRNRDRQGNVRVDRRSDRGNTSGSSVENDAPPGADDPVTPERAAERCQDEKLRRLQQGTVGRNMDYQPKDAIIPPKFHGENVLMRRSSSSKVHVKNLFNAHAAGHLPDNSLEGINLGMFSPKDGEDGRNRSATDSTGGVQMNVLSTPHARKRELSPVIPLYDTGGVDNYSNADDKVLNLTASDEAKRSLPLSHRETMRQLQLLQDVDVDSKLGDSHERKALSNALSAAMKNKTDLNDQTSVITPNITEANSDWRLW